MASEVPTGDPRDWQSVSPANPDTWRNDWELPPLKLKHTEDLTHFETGAVRSVDANAYRFDLISPIGLRRLAATCKEGADKYSDFNWERGMPMHDLLNHVSNHLNQFYAGDRSEDHLAHAAWGLFGAMHSQELWQHLNQGTMRGPNCTPPESETK